MRSKNQRLRNFHKEISIDYIIVDKTPQNIDTMHHHYCCIIETEVGHKLYLQYLHLKKMQSLFSLS